MKHTNTDNTHTPPPYRPHTPTKEWIMIPPERCRCLVHTSICHVWTSRTLHDQFPLFPRVQVQQQHPLSRGQYCSVRVGRLLFWPPAAPHMGWVPGKGTPEEGLERGRKRQMGFETATVPGGILDVAGLPDVSARHQHQPTGPVTEQPSDTLCAYSPPSSDGRSDKLLKLVPGDLSAWRDGEKEEKINNRTSPHDTKHHVRVPSTFVRHWRSAATCTDITIKESGGEEGEVDGRRCGATAVIHQTHTTHCVTHTHTHCVARASHLPHAKWQADSSNTVSRTKRPDCTRWKKKKKKINKCLSSIGQLGSP